MRFQFTVKDFDIKNVAGYGYTVSVEAIPASFYRGFDTLEEADQAFNLLISFYSIDFAVYLVKEYLTKDNIIIKSQILKSCKMPKKLIVHPSYKNYCH